MHESEAGTGTAVVVQPEECIQQPCEVEEGICDISESRRVEALNRVSCRVGRADFALLAKASFGSESLAEFTFRKGDLEQHAFARTGGPSSADFNRPPDRTRTDL